MNPFIDFCNENSKVPRRICRNDGTCRKIGTGREFGAILLWTRAVRIF